MNIIANDNITELLTKFLDVQSRRAEVVSSNIANADTPNYIAKELKFDEYLNQAVDHVALPPSERERFSQSTANLRVVEQTPTAIGMDGNTVDTGKEMADLAQIGTSFNFGAKMLQSRLRLLRSAIREGR